MITHSPLFTYILTLHSLGYSRPLVPRPDLTILECIELLREHQLHWTRPHTLRATRYELDASPRQRSRYVGGVYAHAMLTNWQEISYLHTLHFYQLESKNLGTGFKKWTLQNLEEVNDRLRSFTFDPEQDLLIMVESFRPASNPSVDFQSSECTLHLRTMSTCEAHPKALESALVVQIPGPSHGPFRSFHFEVFGEIFTVRIDTCTTHGKNDSWIIIFNWHRGTEITVSN